MKVHRVVLCIVDFDDLGEDGVRSALENTKYANRCISPDVYSVETRDIGEWDDAHLLNQRSQCRAEFERLFAPPPG